MQIINSHWFLFFSLMASAVALLFASIMLFRVLRRPEGDSTMSEISLAIRESMQVYLNRFLLWVSFLASGFLFLFILRAFFSEYINYLHVLAFFSGVLVSLFTGALGINVSAATNARAAWAAKHSLNRALRVAFSSGAAIGMHVVGLGLLILSIWLGGLYLQGYSLQLISSVFLYFAMGSSFIALFARVGGGIYTRAVSGGFDVLSNMEHGLPQNDLRNPIFIAGNAAKNITAISAVGADLLDSYVGSIIATFILGVIEFPAGKAFAAALAPFLIASIGILASILGTFLVRSLRNENTQEGLLIAYRVGIYFTHILVIVLSWFLLIKVLHLGYLVFFALLFGLVGGLMLGFISQYYTSMQFSPTRRVARGSEIDTATFLLSGLSVGMKSTVMPVLFFTLVAFSVMMFWGGINIPLYLAGMGAVGMVSALGITLSGEAFGPIATNAANVAKMAHQEKAVVERLELVKSLGFSAAANSRGFTIGSALFTSLSLVAVLDSQFHLSQENLPVNSIKGLSAIFIGIMLPIFFSSLSVEAVSRATLLMVGEVKRQFREMSGIMDGSVKPDYKKCVQVSLGETLKRMLVPALLAFGAPILVAFLWGGGALLLTLVSSIGTSFILSILLTTSGGTWASVKNFIERGNHGGVGSASHKAAIIGESFGHPLLESVGPELNILTKVMVITSLLFIQPALHYHNLWFAL